jgi:CO/xanthine dehydrogenase FAD-binding subunit
MYFRPESLENAVQLLAEHDAVVMAGGTDLFPAHVSRPLPDKLLDVTRVPELRSITLTSDHIRFGGAVRWSEILSSDLPRAFNGLKAAAREIGSIQIQNRGTIAGNLCNASPAADSIPPLLALDAEVELASRRGIRVLKLEDFLTGYRSTVKAADEILSAVTVRGDWTRTRSAFRKLGARRYLVISIIMVAVAIELSEAGSIERVGLAIGAASPVAQRLRALENELAGLSAEALPHFEITEAHLAPLSPIDDVRATASYRHSAAGELVKRTLLAAIGFGDA